MATTESQTKASIETGRLLAWLEERAMSNGGVMPAFSNADAVAALHGDALFQFARAHGNVQSRVDFGCYLCGLPPLGLTADRKFANAWSQKSRSWPYPVGSMQAAAQAHRWVSEDFARIRAACTQLPGTASKAWQEEITEREDRVKAWAHSFEGISAQPRAAATASTRFVRVDWVRDELMLALDLYLQNPNKAWDDTDAEVVPLSGLLQRLAPLLGHRVSPGFRNPNGVAMKLMNFRSIDPRHAAMGKKGLSGGGKADREVWDEFATDPERLRLLASAIRLSVENPDSAWRSKYAAAGDSIDQAPEGRILTRSHQVRERDDRLVKRWKQLFWKRHGRFFCEGCGFDFAETYGDDKGEVIDCHHTKPVHTLAPDQLTHVADLVLLCANCHRVVHSSRYWLTVTQLKERLLAVRAARRSPP